MIDGRKMQESLIATKCMTIAQNMLFLANNSQISLYEEVPFE